MLGSRVETGIERGKQEVADLNVEGFLKLDVKNGLIRIQ